MSKKAFTLIELLVVMAIMAILAVVAIPTYNKYRVNAGYSVLESNLKEAETWAESIVADNDRFPNGVCDSSSYSGTGSVKCSYSYDNDSISVDAGGDLKVDIPLKITFTRDATKQVCGKIVVTCPKEGCYGLRNHDDSGDASICIDTCQSVSYIKEDTNLHGVVHGGCP